MTLVELVVVVGVIGVLAALAAPGMGDWLEDQDLKSTARTVSDAFSLARAEAIRTGSNHIVFLGADITGTALDDTDGATLVVVLNDGDPATADCDIDPAEPQKRFRVEPNVDLGVINATAAHPLDSGDSTYGDGFTFVQPRAGSPEAHWVLFRPDGIPVGLTDACATGTTGTGGGALYIHNGRREFAVVVTPLGAVRVSSWEDGEGTWD